MAADPDAPRTATAGGDRINGALGDDAIDGAGGDDVLNGGGGNDRLEGGAGNDRLVGGVGDDRSDGGEGDDVLAGHTGQDELHGGPGRDWLGGDPGNDRLSGGPGPDHVRGGRDADRIEGGDGDDRLAGSPGSDVFVFARSPSMGLDLVEDFTFHDGDRMVVDFDAREIAARDAADGAVLSHGGIDFALVAGHSAEGFTTLWFEPLAVPVRNHVPRPNIVRGTGDRANDLAGTAGNDLLNMQDGDDGAFGLAGDDWIDGGAGDDALRGGDGNDIVYGGVAAGRDTILGEGGDDLAFAGNGEDAVDGGAGEDLLFGGPGRDALRGGDGADRLYGEDGGDALLGGPGGDRLDGGPAGDSLEGGSGGDVLIGGAGDDVLAGGDGADLFLLRLGGGDRVLDFAFVDGDRLALEGVDEQAGLRAGLSVTAEQGGLVLAHRGQPFARLAGTTADGDPADWFVVAPPAQPPLYPMDSAVSVNRAPVVVPVGESLAAGETVLAAALFSVADPDGDPILRYEVRDTSPQRGSGRFVVAGPAGDAYVRAGIPTAFAPDRFATLRVEEGTLRDDDGLLVRAYDGSLWSEWTPIG